MNGYPPQVVDQSGYELQLSTYWYSIRRHSRFIIFCMLLCLTVMAIRIQTMPDRYTSTTTILVENKGYGAATGNIYGFPPPVDTEIFQQRILSTPVMQRVQSILGKPVPGWFSVGFPSKEKAYGSQRLATITATSGAPEDAFLMVQAIVTAMRDELRDSQLQQSKDSLRWMAERLADQKQKVEESEARFQEYKQEIQVLSFEDQQAEESRRVISSTNELSQLESQSLQLQVKLNKLREAQNKGEEYSDLVFSSQSSEQVSALISELNALKSTLTAKLHVFKEKHPEIVDLKNQIANLRTRIEAEKNDAVTTLSIQIRTLNDQADVIRTSISGYKSNARSVAENELQYRILEREVQTNTELYNSLLSELEKTDLKGKIESTSITTIEPARRPGGPIPKQVTRQILFAVLLGLGLGGGLAILRDYFEPTFRTPEDVEQALNIPVVGMIPERE